MAEWSESRKLVILIVDDSRTNIIALNHILKPTYSTLAAINGKTALKIAREIVPDLILLDVVMPDISGFEVLAELKSIDELRRIPVIFITGMDSLEDEERGFALGAADYIVKPFHSSIVKARVETQLRMVEYIRTIERLSHVDMLTNILNRRGFDERLAAAWSRAVREQEPLSVLMIDIDRFKNFNDTHGHLKGDAALRTVAKTLRGELKRGSDLIARWGGEEFVVLLPGTDSDGALTVAEAMRAAVEQAVIEDTGTSVTISIGANTETPTVNSSQADYIAEADKKLYEAKSTGRNKVCR